MSYEIDDKVQAKLIVHQSHDNIHKIKSSNSNEMENSCNTFTH